MDSRELTKLSDRITEEITTSNGPLLSIFPITKYVRYIERYPKISGYGYVSQEVEDLCKGIVYANGDHILGLYHQLILVNLILIARNKLEKMDYPQDIKDLYDSNFERIMKEIESRNQIGSYNYAHDKFRKNLALCSLRMIPAGAAKIHLSGISRRFIFKKGFAQLIKILTFVLFELGGFSPLFEMHSDSNDPELLSDFNENGRVKFYKRVSLLLKTQQDVKGIFGSSWFYDPKLEIISPRLAYLSRIPTANGGKLFYMGSDSQCIKDATLKSPTRRKLYEENKYMPTNYLLVWSRKKLISWAEKQG
jgi:hypothetical protein